MDIPFTTATSPTGFGVTKAFDTVRASQWIVTSPPATLEVYFGQGATPRTFPTLAVGVSNHNLATCGCDGIQVSRSDTYTSPSWTLITTLPAPPNDNDHMWFVSTSFNKRALKLGFVFGTPLANPAIGEIQVGSAHDVTTSDETADKPFQSSLMQAVTLFDLPGGGQASIIRPSRAEVCTFTFGAIPVATRDSLRQVWSESLAGGMPCFAHTHRHDGAEAWTNAGGTPNVSHGGAYYGRILSADFNEATVESRFSTALSFRREMGAYDV